MLQTDMEHIREIQYHNVCHGNFAFKSNVIPKDTKQATLYEMNTFSLDQL